MFIMRTPDNLILTIFGASGDLTQRKLIPALFNLKSKNLLPPIFGVLGVGRTPITSEQFRERMREGIAKHSTCKDGDLLTDFLGQLHYCSIDTKSPEGYSTFRKELQSLDARLKVRGNYLYYLATPPELYSVIPENLKQQNICDQCDGQGWKRLIVEKPFGYDLKSAQALNSKLLESFKEEQIYRIDHYLGKETAQNILVTRFFNGIFEPLWNRNYIERVEITSSESVGVEGRGGYYDTSGALRDMVQNHILQLVALTAMEPPTVFNADAIRNEVLKVFQALRPLDTRRIGESVIRGQYVESKIKGQCTPAYTQEKGVEPCSRTETYVALKFYIDNWRWGGVPFLIRTGKRLPTRVTEIVVHFKPTPHPAFLHGAEPNDARNQLIIRIQPDEGMLLKFGMKTPGAGYRVQPANLNFRYSDFTHTELPEAYERLLHDAMIGDASLFNRGDAVIAAWEFVEPILKAWRDDPSIKLYGYPAGTWGPDKADSLIGEGQQWRYPCKNLTNDGLYCEL